MRDDVHEASCNASTSRRSVQMYAFIHCGHYTSLSALAFIVCLSNLNPRTRELPVTVSFVHVGVDTCGALLC